MIPLLTDLELCTSTQTFIKDYIDSHKVIEPFAITAARQTNGYGAKGGRWEDSPGNLHLSICIPQDDIPPHFIPPTIGYACYLAIVNLYGHGDLIKIKLINDLYLADKKCGGVICEAYKDFYIIGIGININSAPQNCYACLSSKISTADANSIKNQLLTDLPSLITLLKLGQFKTIAAGLRPILYSKIPTTISGISGHPVDITDNAQVILH